MTTPRAYANPYWCGVALGLVLLGAYALAGRGLGASGAFAGGASALVATASPQAAAANSYFAGYLGGGGVADLWLAFEVLGVLIGGLSSAWLSGRFRVAVTRGPSIGRRARMTAAAAGGAMMGAGAVLARGCTSGQALTGGAMLSVGSWLFMAAVFIAGFSAAQLVGRLWR